MRDLGFLSLREHHLLPFFGNCQVGFAFRTRARDLEWCGRVVKTFAHRLQLQERLTEQIADALFQALEPEGLGW
jgi:GTP cyclohydrolase I